MARDDRDRPRTKKTWSEIDRAREKGRSGGGRDSDGQPKSSSPAAMAAAKTYRAALEKAFSSGTLAELAETLTRRPEVAVKPAAAGTPQNGAHRASPAPTVTAGSAATATDGAGNVAAAQLPPQQPQAPKDPERENRMKLVAKIKEAEGRDAISRAVDAFLAKYPKLPSDFEVLTKVLSHKDDDRIREAMQQVSELLDREKPRRARTLVGQLRMLEETHGDAEIRKTAAELRARL